MYAQLNIGRDVATVDGPSPMWAGEWEQFREDAAAAVRAATGATSAEIHYGEGVYDGHAEESAHVSAHSDGPYVTGAYSNLWTAARDMARRYDQECIYVIFDDGDGVVFGELVAATD